MHYSLLLYIYDHSPFYHAYHGKVGNGFTYHGKVGNGQITKFSY